MVFIMILITLNTLSFLLFLLLLLSSLPPDFFLNTKEEERSYVLFKRRNEFDVSFKNSEHWLHLVRIVLSFFHTLS